MNIEQMNNEEIVEKAMAYIKETHYFFIVDSDDSADDTYEKNIYRQVHEIMNDYLATRMIRMSSLKTVRLLTHECIVLRTNNLQSDLADLLDQRDYTLIDSYISDIDLLNKFMSIIA